MCQAVATVFYMPTLCFSTFVVMIFLFIDLIPNRTVQNEHGIRMLIFGGWGWAGGQGVKRPFGLILVYDLR